MIDWRGSEFSDFFIQHITRNNHGTCACGSESFTIYLPWQYKEDKDKNEGTSLAFMHAHINEELKVISNYMYGSNIGEAVILVSCNKCGLIKTFMLSNVAKIFKEEYNEQE